MTAIVIGTAAFVAAWLLPLTIYEAGRRRGQMEAHAAELRRLRQTVNR